VFGSSTVSPSAIAASEATLQEICDVLRGVFGEAEPVKI
jgi:hypothetical protein